MILVENINGTTGNPVPGGFSSCLDYWKHCKGYSLNTNVYCAAANHFHYAEVGAHVKKVNSTDNRWYIVPVCKAINNSSKYFYVEESDLVLLRK